MVSSSIMKHTINEETKTIYFRGKYPDVVGIPVFMKKYPGYTAEVLSWDAYEERYGKS